MNAENWKQIKEVFNQAVELDTLSRVNFLRSFENPVLETEVKKLIAADKNAQTLFEDTFFITDKAIDNYPKEFIGNYKILREIGRGGMGTVFLAERVDLKQKVALKVIRQGIDSDVILRRFRREQEILAALDHPNIARLLDIGVSDDNIPFLVMEYVEGEDLLEFCRRRNFSVNEKLILFRKVCAAVSYAHSRLVVHRDLKPSNILVNEKGEPKLLDFGISKLLSTDSNDNNRTLTTGFAMLTPNYASPEQFRGESISTATDIYSLGVILFEVLTGSLPYQLESRRLDEIMRIVSETNPIRPSSVRLQSIWESEKSTKQNAGQTNESNQNTGSNAGTGNLKSLRGDLDNIVLKALRKEAEKRYSSVEQFSEDIGRHLVGLPVTARPATFGYRAEKFFKRNRSAVTAAILIFLTLLGGIAGTSWQAIRAERERELAEKRFAEVRGLANNIIYKYHDEIKNLSGATKVREMLVADALEYLNRLEEDTGDNVSLQRELAEAYMRVGDVQGEPYQANAGDTAGAIESYRKATILLENVLQKSSDLPTERRLRQAIQQLSSLLLRAGDKSLLDIAQRSIEISEQIAAQEPENTDDKLALAKSYIFLGDITPLGVGENESISVFRKALAIVEPIAKNEPDNINAIYRLMALNQRCGFHYSQIAERASEIEKTEEARQFFLHAAPFYQRTLEMSERLIQLDPQNANYNRNAAGAKYAQAYINRQLGETDKALPVLLKVLDERKAAVVADHENVQAQADLSEVNSDVSLVYLKRKEFPRALEFARAANFAIDEAVRRDAANLEYKGGQYHVHLLYGDVLVSQNNFEKAIEIYRTAFADFSKTVRPENRTDFKALESTMHEKVADAFMLLSEKANLTIGEKRARLTSARIEYQTAIDLMQLPENIKDGSVNQRTIERRSYLETKRFGCETILNTL